MSHNNSERGRNQDDFRFLSSNNWVVVGGIDSPREDRIRRKNRAVHLVPRYKPVNLKLLLNI